MSQQNAPERAGNIEKFRISSNFTDYAVDLSPGVVDFRYYEDVLSNNITATATCIETGYQEDGSSGAAPAQSTVDGLPIRGGERTDFVLEDGYGNKLELEEGIYVNRLRDVDAGTQQDLYFIDFASREFFANEQTRVVKRYEGNIGDNVEKILKDVLKVTTDIQVDKTAVPYNFIGNDRKPFYICTWLASKSIPEVATEDAHTGIKGAAGYLFFQTRDGYHFRSIDKIFQDKPKKKFIFTNTTNMPEGYDAKILRYDINSDIDLGKNLMMGMLNNRSIFFNPLSFSYEVRNFPDPEVPPVEGQIVEEGTTTLSEKEYVDLTENAAEKPVVELVKKEFKQSPTRLMSFVLDTGVMPSGTTSQEQLERWKSDKGKSNYDAKNTLVQSIMRYNQLFAVKTEITIAGDFSIKAGDVIQCDFSELKGTEQGDSVNTESQGLYMVASVCHKITPREVFSSLSLVRDSFGGNK